VQLGFLISILEFENAPVVATNSFACEVVVNLILVIEALGNLGDVEGFGLRFIDLLAGTPVGVNGVQGVQVVPCWVADDHFQLVHAHIALGGVADKPRMSKDDLAIVTGYHKQRGSALENVPGQSAQAGLAKIIDLIQIDRVAAEIGHDVGAVN